VGEVVENLLIFLRKKERKNFDSNNLLNEKVMILIIG